MKLIAITETTLVMFGMTKSPATLAISVVGSCIILSPLGYRYNDLKD